MGPFELMDLVGVDVNFEVAKSFWEQSFHEPRWQPHPIQSRMVAAGRLGRKAGRGYYDYGAARTGPTTPTLGPESRTRPESIEGRSSERQRGARSLAELDPAVTRSASWRCRAWRNAPGRAARGPGDQPRPR